MKTATPYVTLVLTLAMLTGSGPVLSQSTGVPPFFPFTAHKAQPRAAAPAFPWQQRRPQAARPVFAAPWAPIAPPMTGPSPFGVGFGMPGMSSGLGMMTGPMMQGMMGMVAPFAVNYMVASMNPTTMGNFFGLMTRPSGFGMGGFNPMAMMGNPIGGYGGGYGAPRTPAGFPFLRPPARNPAMGFPFSQPVRPQPGRMAVPFSWPGSQPAPAKPVPRSRTPRRSPFPFPPFSIVGK